jgi:enoyl-[acyl-carrier protein] reductase I
MSGLLKGKKILITGVANDRSIAWGIAKFAVEQGAEVALSYQNETLLKRVQPLADSVGIKYLIECDATDEASLDKAFTGLKEAWGALDGVVHAIAFADKNELKGRYVDTSHKGFMMAMDISCYSFVAISKHAAAMMAEGGSIVTLTYYGAEKVIPNYNVMGVAKAALEASMRYVAADLGPDGIRVNAISAGPIKTLAASGIGDFRSFLKYAADNSPMRDNVSQEDVARSAAYLLSDLGRGVTGEVIYVDNGYNIMGMQASDSNT